MALTHELDNPQSPVFKYLQARCPFIDGMKRGAPLANELQEVLAAASIPKLAVLQSSVAPASRSVVGTAFDYRVRHHLGEFDVYDTVAMNGSRLLAGATEGRSAQRLADVFFKKHEALVKRLGPARVRLPQDNEDLLARHCIILAYYEAIFRAGPAIRSPLYDLPSNARLDDLLGLPSAEAVQDVRQLAWAFEEDFRDLLDARCVSNPVFAGSVAIGGADADFIIGGTLFELKTFTEFKPGDLRDTLYQLVGYTLLDYNDAFKIRELGFYLSRQRTVRRVPLWYVLLSPREVIALAKAGNRPDDTTIDALLKIARREFKSAVDSLSAGIYGLPIYESPA